MILSNVAGVTLGAAVVLILGGAVALSRLRGLRADVPAAYAARIAGTMLLMLGLILTVFTLTYASSVPIS